MATVVALQALLIVAALLALRAGVPARALAWLGAEPAATPAPLAPIMPATVRWVPEHVIEGTIFRVVIEGGEPAVARAHGEFGGERLHFDPAGESVFTALAAAPLDSVGGRVLRVALELVDGRADVQLIEVPVQQGEYRMERLTVAPQFGRPQPPEIQARIAEEGARARAVSVASHDTPRLWELPFLAPRESRITSGFGHGRMFNDELQSRHTGTDFAGAVGAPVRAPARGVVALVDEFYLGGNVIYIDHGAGLVTGYLHLSAHAVVQGDTVQPGQLIGRVGATGRVTGPHLHWIVRYGRHSVDGLTLLSAR